MNDSIPSFYSQRSLHVEIYDLMTETKWGKLHSDISFYVEEARASGGPVLELACGTGRISIPLASAALEVHGLDLNRSMLEVADRKRLVLPDAIADRLQFHEGNMLKFNLKKQFALILIPFRSFQVLQTTKDQRRCLAQVRKHLAPGGRLILNLFDPAYEYLQPGSKGPSQSTELTHPISGNRVCVETRERVNDPLNQIFRETWRFTEFASSGKTIRQEEEMIQLKWTFRPEMQLLLESCGFGVVAEYSDFKKSAPAYGREQIWILSPK